MPEFSTRSIEKLSTCHYLLFHLFDNVVGDYDCTIIDGHRGKEEQNKLFAQGFSKVKYPYSFHNSEPKSMAVDVVPYPVNWKDIKRFYHFAGFVKGIARSLDISIRWGGDWDGDTDLNDQTFYDLAHYELI